MKDIPFEDMKKKNIPTKKKYLVGLNIERAEKIKDYLKEDKDHKVSFSEFMDYLLKNFYNQFKDQIESKTKEGGKS